MSAFVQKFLSGGITAAHPETIRKMKALIIFELAFIFFTPLLGFFYLTIGADFLFYACIAAGFYGIAAISFLRITKHPGLVGNLSVLILWILLAIIRWNTGSVGAGGLLLLSWIWNAVLILLAIFITGYLWGTIWSCLIFIESGLAVYLFRAGKSFINLIPPEISPVYALGAYLTGLLLILLLAFMFRKGKEDAEVREKEKSRMLKGSNKYLNDILEKLPIPTFVLDTEHRVVHWNRACKKLTGIKYKDIIGKKVDKAFSPEDNRTFADELLDNPTILKRKYDKSIVSMSKSGSFAIRTRLPRLKWGKEAIVHTAPIIDQDGMVTGAIQMIQDIRMPYPGGKQGGVCGPDSVENSDGFPVFKIDVNGNISAWDNVCQSKFGFSLPQMIDKSPLKLVAKPYHTDFTNTYRQVFNGDHVKGKEWRYVTGNGKPLYVLADAVPLYDENGQIRECVIVNVDITDLKMRLKKFERMASECTEKYKRLSEEHNLLKKNIASYIRKK